VFHSKSYNDVPKFARGLPAHKCRFGCLRLFSLIWIRKEQFSIQLLHEPPEDRVLYLVFLQTMNSRDQSFVSSSDYRYPDECVPEGK